MRWSTFRGSDEPSRHPVGVRALHPAVDAHRPGGLVGDAMKKAHQWRTFKRINWPICSSCGLVRLRNDVSRRAARGPCHQGDRLEKEGKAIARRMGLQWEGEPAKHSTR